jgi:hypothetical protein
MFAKPATLTFVFQDDGKLCPGSRLRGRLLLTVHKEIVAEFVSMRFYGVENTRVHIRENSWAYQDSEIFSVINILDTFTGPSLLRNTYTYHFDIPIPPHIPGSQKWKRAGNKFKISYHCQAMLHRKGMLTWNVKAESLVEIHDEPYFSLPTAMYIGPVTTDAKYMFGSPPGSNITYGAEVHTIYVSPNKTLRVNYAIQNTSASRVKALDICIKQIVWVTACGYFQLSVKKIFSKRIDGAKLTIETIDNNKREIGDMDYNYNMLLQRIKEGEFGFDLPIGAVNQSTFSRTLCMVKYELRIKVMTTFGTPNSKIKIPIIINRNDSIYRPVHVGKTENVENVVGVEIAQGMEEEGKVDIIPPDSNPKNNRNHQNDKNNNNVHVTQSTSDQDHFISPVDAATPDLTAVYTAVTEATEVSTETTDALSMLPVLDPDTVEQLIQTLKGSHEVEEINILRDWLASSPTNINLLTPVALYSLFQSIKGYYNIYMICRAIGEAMSQQNSCNRCTCRHIGEASKGATIGSKVAVCKTFAPYCVDRRNAREAFLVTGIETHLLRELMMHYI